jgi:hypothetical protein
MVQSVILEYVGRKMLQNPVKIPRLGEWQPPTIMQPVTWGRGQQPSLIFVKVDIAWVSTATFISWQARKGNYLYGGSTARKKAMEFIFLR